MLGFWTWYLPQVHTAVPDLIPGSLLHPRNQRQDCHFPGGPGYVGRTQQCWGSHCHEDAWVFVALLLWLRLPRLSCTDASGWYWCPRQQGSMDRASVPLMSHSFLRLTSRFGIVLEAPPEPPLHVFLTWQQVESRPGPDLLQTQLICLFLVEFLTRVLEVSVAVLHAGGGHIGIGQGRRHAWTWRYSLPRCLLKTFSLGDGTVFDDGQEAVRSCLCSASFQKFNKLFFPFLSQTKPLCSFNLTPAFMMSWSNTLQKSPMPLA